jgi:drug/metabolite transporter (DMT)-like permease
MGGGVILIYESLPYIPVSTVNTLDNLAPIFIFFIEAVAYKVLCFFTKKCLDFVSLTLAVLSFIGVMLIIQPEFIFGSNQQQPVENLSFYVTLMILAAIFTALNVHFVHGLGK